MDQRRRRLPTVILVLVLAALLPAGLLQFHLLNQASDAEAAGLRRVAATALREIRSEIGYEVAGLVSLLSSWDRADFDSSALVPLYDAWEAGARFPTMVARVVVAVPGDGAQDSRASVYEYKPGDDDGFTAGDPAALPWLDSIRFDSSVDGWAGTGVPDVLAVPGFRAISRPDSGTPPRSGASYPRVFVQIDRRVLADTVVAQLVDEHLGAGPGVFHVALLDLSNAAVVYSTANVVFADFALDEAAPGSRPDRSDLPVGRISPDEWGSLAWPGSQYPLAVSLRASVAERGRDPATERWLALLEWARFDDSNRSRELPTSEAGLALAVWHRAGSIADAALRDRNRNLVLSYAFLAGVASMAIVFHALYRRTQRQRAREQEFVATVTHELRTPVAAIHASAENLASGVVTRPERVREYGASLLEEGRRLRLLIDQTLHLAGLQTGGRASARTVRLDTLVASVVADQPAVGDYEIDVDVQPEAREAVVDETAVRSIVANLVSNAVKHNPGGTRIGVWIGHEYEARRSWLVITVTDDGVGIPRRELRRVREAFFRGSRSLRAQVAGTGLGLAIVERAARSAGGSLEIASAVGRGTRATVRLPYARSHATDSPCSDR